MHSCVNNSHASPPVQLIILILPQPNKTRLVQRTKEDFEKKLKEFFHRHDPERAILSGQIASHFINHQDEIFEHLTELYAEKAGIDIHDDALFSVNFGPNYGAEPF